MGAARGRHPAAAGRAGELTDAERDYAWRTVTEVLLSTSSVFPEPTSAAFEMAADLGYDGVEVMVWTDAVSQDAAALRGLSEHYGVPVGSVHAPCLLVTQRVWSPDPWERLRRAAGLAETLGAPIVVVHPPFAWQRDYARGFARGHRRAAHGVRLGRVRGGEHVPGADGRSRVRARTRPVTTRPRSASTRTPWICRTAPRRGATCSRWPTRWAPALPTSTSATAPARRATSTWCPAGATSRAASCCRRWPGAGSPARSRSR